MDDGSNDKNRLPKRCSLRNTDEKKAFDLMVARNCEMFRKVGKYDKRWYLSDLYLKELSEKAFFEFVSAKYEMMAKEMNRLSEANECMH